MPPERHECRLVGSLQAGEERIREHTDQLYGALTPPDQGLCVGPDHTLKGAPDAVWEIVNSVAKETTKSGAALVGPLNAPTLFQDPNAFSDPRCLFDPATQSFYFTLISFPASGPNSTLTNTVNGVTQSYTYQKVSGNPNNWQRLLSDGSNSYLYDDSGDVR